VAAMVAHLAIGGAAIVLLVWFRLCRLREGRPAGSPHESDRHRFAERTRPGRPVLAGRGHGWLGLDLGPGALDPRTGTLVEKDAVAQADRALRNIGAILEAAGSGWNQVVRATVFLTDMDDFATVNAVYAKYLPASFPARVCVEVSRLPLGALVEIDVTARVVA
jgi:2-iminobutanoate/2-iminopropanoate deaminase